MKRNGSKRKSQQVPISTDAGKSTSLPNARGWVSYLASPSSDITEDPAEDGDIAMREVMWLAATN